MCEGNTESIKSRVINGLRRKMDRVLKLDRITGWQDLKD